MTFNSQVLSSQGTDEQVISEARADFMRLFIETASGDNQAHLLTLVEAFKAESIERLNRFHACCVVERIHRKTTGITLRNYLLSILRREIINDMLQYDLKITYPTAASLIDDFCSRFDFQVEAGLHVDLRYQLPASKSQREEERQRAALLAGRLNYFADKIHTNGGLSPEDQKQFKKVGADIDAEIETRSKRRGSSHKIH